MAPVTLFFGTFVDLPRLNSGRKHELSINHGVLWMAASTGRVEGFDWSVDSEEKLQSLVRKNGWADVQIVRAREDQNEFFFPGFIGTWLIHIDIVERSLLTNMIDTHIHAPQYPNSGLFGSSTLLDWLESYTFPLESSMSSLSKARTAYDTVISRTLANGTTCASYFATIHVAATNLLATLCHTRGQRALIGRVCMDNPSYCPEYYRDESAQSSTSATEETISHIHTLDPESNLIKPIITPRFVPTCSCTALASLGALAASHTPPLHIQTHISENTSECALVRSLFPEYPSYAAVYDAYSLLTPRTILAHAVHLTREEKELIASRKAKVSHCPASNSALGSGIAPVRDLIDKGITVGLGTDVSGGYSPSILEAVRQACLVSRLLGHTTSEVGEGADGNGKKEEGREVLSVEEALYLATRGGAAVVDMDGELGGFEVGMFWDVQMIRLGPTTAAAGTAAATASTAGSGSETQSVVDIFGWESWTEKVHKWVWSGDDRNVRRVWVRGTLVHSIDGDSDNGSEQGLFGLASDVMTKDWVRWAMGGVGVGALGLILGGRARRG